MGLFDNLPFIGRHEEKRQLEAEKRQENFAREQNLMASANSPQSDVLYFQEKKEKEELVRWAQDLREDVADFLMNLMGYFRNGEGKYVPDTTAKATCNAQFIRTVKQYLHPFLSKNQYMSNYDTEQANMKLRQTFHELNWEMVYNMDSYGFPNLQTARGVYEALFNHAENALHRSIGDAERKHAFGSHKHIHTQHEGSRDGSPGMLARLGGQV